MRVQSLGREDPLEKEMATDSSILAWRIPWTEEPGDSVPDYCDSHYTEGRYINSAPILVLPRSIVSVDLCKMTASL